MSLPSPRVGLILLTLFMLVNFWDRAAFGFASTPIMRDLRLSHAEFGLLSGVFFWLFCPSALAIGWLADRWSPKWILGSMAVVWAVAQSFMAAAFSLLPAFMSRLLLGLGEGPALPTAIHSAYSVFARDSRATVTAFIGAGMPLGIASGALVITAFVDWFGWRAAFASLSLISVAWSIVWFAVHMRANSNPMPIGFDKPRLRLAHLSSTALGVIIAAFCVYWVLALAINWFPATLQVVNGLSPIGEGKLLASAWALQILVFPLAVRLSKSLRRRSYRSEVVFAAPAASAVAISGLALVAVSYFVSSWVALALIAVCLSCTAIAITCLPPIIAEVTRSGERGTALGAFAAFSSTAGIFAPLVFGRIVDVCGGGGHGYRVALLVSGWLLIVAAPVAMLLMKPTRHAVVDDYEENLAAFG
jgi:MFS transporter, ACS family, D-galactonate transporter